MGTSKQLITALERADWLDRLVIMAALSFFILVVLFILKQRIFDRGLRFALWWTKWIPVSVPDFGGDEALIAKVEEGLVSVVSSVEEVVMTAVASVVSGTVTSSLPTVSSVSTGDGSATGNDDTLSLFTSAIPPSSSVPNTLDSNAENSFLMGLVDPTPITRAHVEP